MRNKSLDAVKAIAACLVVCIHVSFPGQAGPDRGEAPRARAARQGDSGRDSREARSQEGVTSGLAATDLRTLLHHVCARDLSNSTCSAIADQT